MKPADSLLYRRCDPKSSRKGSLSLGPASLLTGPFFFGVGAFGIGPQLEQRRLRHRTLTAYTSDEASVVNQRFVQSNLLSHPELVSGSNVPQKLTVPVARWMLKRVQHDGVRRYQNELLVHPTSAQLKHAANSLEDFDDGHLYMNVQDQIKEYIASQSEPKRSDMQALHDLILQIMPACQLWFLDGKNSEGKIVSNPNIGYGFQTIKYADGKTRDFYQIGVSANTTGISVYILGIEDKKYLAQTYGDKLGKASVSGYCIKFKSLRDIDVTILEAAIRYGIEKR
jgi:hypothetical protein